VRATVKARSSTALDILLTWASAGLLVLCGTLGWRVFQERVTVGLAPPYPTPVALSLAFPADERAARDVLYSWLRAERGLRETTALPFEMEDKAYYLAGEAPRLNAGWQYLHSGWPTWPGYRYVVGSADGRWRHYWSGCQTPGSGQYHFDGTLWVSYGPKLAEHPFPGLAEASAAGAAVAVREGQTLVAIIWAWPDACPAPVPVEYGRDLPPSGPAP